MSARGMEIHNGSITFPEGSPPKLHMGTEASPLTQGEAGQIVHSAVINAGALGGNVAASYNRVNVSADMTGNIVTLESKAIVDEDQTLTGNLKGLHIQAQLMANGVVDGLVEGATIYVFSAAGAELNSDVRVLYVAGYNLGAVIAGGTHEMIRIEENGTMIPDNILGVYTHDAVNFLHLSPAAPAGGAWNADGDVTGSAAGFIKVSCGGNRYIQLYAYVP